MTGIDLISKERKEQLTKHHRSIIKDVQDNCNGQLRSGARKLLIPNPSNLEDYPPEGWDKRIWKKMCNKPYKQRLIIAGALIAAEIDRKLYNE